MTGEFGPIQGVNHMTGAALTMANDVQTTGSVQLGNVSYWYQPYNYWHNYWPLPQQIYITYPSQPFSCLENCHVFACEHATACKCGKATRQTEPKRCSTCGH